MPGEADSEPHAQHDSACDAPAHLTAPTYAAGYPVSGQWGQTANSEKGPVDCSKLRVIFFNGDTHTDSKGGVPGYRLKSISAEDPSSHRIIDEFTSGQIRNGNISFTLRQIDNDRVEMHLQQGGTLKLQRCK
jgi:hypothetical protein